MNQLLAVAGADHHLSAHALAVKVYGTSLSSVFVHFDLDLSTLLVAFQADIDIDGRCKRKEGCHDCALAEPGLRSALLHC